jgi:prepilin-type N-terminal cleavage/methylation domain-containing protein
MNRFAFSRGFTIVELMVTVAIAAILLAVAVPSFTSFAQKRAVSQKTVQVRNALELARGLALSQRQILTVCTVNALNSCVSTGGLRLLVFFDLDLSNGFNAGDNLHQDLDINSILIKLTNTCCSWPLSNGALTDCAERLISISIWGWLNRLLSSTCVLLSILWS